MESRPTPSALSALASSPWRTAFSTSGWMQRNGTATGSTSGRDLQRHLQPVAEARLLEQEVALDGAELLGERRVLAVAAEGVAREVGELEQQLAGAVGVRTHEAGDRAERVVDEVRADLRPQGTHLGLHQPGAREVELGELELSADPRRDLVGRTDQPAGGVRGADDQRADEGVLDDQRADDRLRHLAAAVLADQGPLVDDHRATGLRDLADRARELAAVVGAEAVPRQQPAGVTEPGGRSARGARAGGPRTAPRSPTSGPRAARGSPGRRCAGRGRRRGRPRRPGTYAATSTPCH